MANILLIEDDQAILDTLELLLHRRGHQVYKASTGRRGVELFYQARPDIVFLDIGLPDCNGIDLLCQMHQAREHVTIFMMTASRDQNTHLRAMKHGASAYFCKPLDAYTIRRAVDNAAA